MSKNSKAVISDFGYLVRTTDFSNIFITSSTYSDLEEFSKRSNFAKKICEQVDKNHIVDESTIDTNAEILSLDKTHNNLVKAYILLCQEYAEVEIATISARLARYCERNKIPVIYVPELGLNDCEK